MTDWYRLAGQQPPINLSANNPLPSFFVALRTKSPTGEDKEVITHTYDVATRSYAVKDASRVTIVRDPFSLKLDNTQILSVQSGVLSASSFVQGNIVSDSLVIFYMRLNTVPNRIISVNLASIVGCVEFTEVAAITNESNRISILSGGIAVATIGFDGLVVASIAADDQLLVSHTGEFIVTHTGENIVIP